MGLSRPVMGLLYLYLYDMEARPGAVRYEAYVWSHLITGIVGANTAEGMMFVCCVCCML
jgi:hypothetical protein